MQFLVNCVAAKSRSVSPALATIDDGSHRLDQVMIRPPGIMPGGFVVSPDSVWYSRVLLLFSASAATDTGSKSFDCVLVLTMETFDDPENGDHYLHYCHYFICYSLLVCHVCWHSPIFVGNP